MIIDDSTPDSFFQPTRDAEGFKGMFRSAASANAISVPFDRNLLIPRHEWQARIEERQQRKTRNKDLMLQAGIRAKNQASTNFCWCFAPVMLLMFIRMKQGQPFVSLSPASVACLINGFKNRGGFGEEALEWLLEHGAVPTENWPDTAIDRRYDTPANKQLAENFKADEYWRITPRDVDEQISCLLLGLPLAVGLNYWGHEVLDMDPIWENGQIGVEFLNSWDEDWGDQGYGKRQGNRMLADDAVTIRTGYAR